MEQRELNVAEFNGYVKAKLEDIGETTKSINVKLELLEKCVNGMKVKVAAIGGTISLIVTVLVLVLKNIIEK